MKNSNNSKYRLKQAVLVKDNGDHTSIVLNIDDDCLYQFEGEASKLVVLLNKAMVKSKGALAVGDIERQLKANNDGLNEAIAFMVNKNLIELESNGSRHKKA